MRFNRVLRSLNVKINQRFNTVDHLIPLKDTFARVWHSFRPEFSNHDSLGGSILLVHVRLNESALISHFPIGNPESGVAKRFLLLSLTVNTKYLSRLHIEFPPLVNNSFVAFFS